MIPIGTRMV